MHTPHPTEPEVRELRDALEGVLDNLARATQPSWPLCPIDGCLLRQALEPCPSCAVEVMVEPCGRCGTLVARDKPCRVCALERATGRRSLVRPVPVGVMD